MSIAAWVFVGVLTGIVFNQLSRQPARRLPVHAIFGAAGAFVGGLGYHMIEGLGWDFHARSLIAAVVGAIAVVMTYQWMRQPEPVI